VALAAGLLVVVGAFFSNKIFLAGLGCLGALGVLQLASSLLADYVARRGRIMTIAVTLGGLCLLGLAGLGANDLYVRAGTWYHRLCAQGGIGLLEICPAPADAPSR
jgi:hypothetical protein